MRERILLCKPKMSGRELDFIRPALAEDWAVPMGPDVNAFEKELAALSVRKMWLLWNRELRRFILH